MTKPDDIPELFLSLAAVFVLGGALIACAVASFAMNMWGAL